MVSVAQAVAVLFPAAAPGVDYEVQDDGQGAHIVRWIAARLGPRPTPQQLAAVTAAQVTAHLQQQAQAAAQALLADPGATGTALRAIYLAAGLTAAQVSAQLPAAGQGG
jgi:hypothetical protein